jgi:hypothetical protein
LPEATRDTATGEALQAMVDLSRDSWLGQRNDPTLPGQSGAKMARSVLRHIRVASKEELKARILAYLDDLNRTPVIHTWTYKIDTAA